VKESYFDGKKIINHNSKVKKVYEVRLDSIPSPSPSMKIQIMGGKVCLRCNGKTLLDIDNKLAFP
jgi:hypothetical protein